MLRLQYGTDSPRRQGNPAEQKRVTVERLTCWVARDGGNAPRVTTAIRTVLDEHGPDRQAPRVAVMPMDGPARAKLDRRVPSSRCG